jgi:secreted trypsin-like serine protease
MPRIKITTPRLIGAAFVAAVTSAAIVGSTGTANAIANGTPVPDGQYSFSAKLTMTGIPNPDGTKRDSACSGALIAPQWIVTAGHCFHDVNGNRVSGQQPYDATTATVGRTDLSSTSGHVVDVDKVWQAPRGDVALGLLESAITDITPLPMAAAAPKAGAILRMTGWGATSSVNPVPVTHLMTGQVKVKRVNGTSVLVVGYAPPDTSACLWDSGAPYFSESSGGTAALVSVESDGPACPHSQEETTTRIDRNAEWIRQTIAQSTPAPIRGV